MRAIPMPTAASSQPAPLWRAVLAQTWVELLLSLRRGESVLVTLVIPAVLLVFFMSVGAIPVPIARPIDFLLPGTLALAVMATGLANLGIATAYERGDGVLKRLGATPLPRAGLVAGKLLAVVALEVIQVLALVLIAALQLGASENAQQNSRINLVDVATSSGLNFTLFGFTALTTFPRVQQGVALSTAWKGSCTASSRMRVRKSMEKAWIPVLAVEMRRLPSSASRLRSSSQSSVCSTTSSTPLTRQVTPTFSSGSSFWTDLIDTSDWFRMWCPRKTGSAIRTSGLSTWK